MDNSSHYLNVRSGLNTIVGFTVVDYITCLFSFLIVSRKVPFFNWIALHICPCCNDGHFRKFPTSNAGITEYSTMTEADNIRISSIHYRRPSGLPFVRNSLSDKENEILLKTLKSNAPEQSETWRRTTDSGVLQVNVKPCATCTSVLRNVPQSTKCAVKYPE